MKRSFCIVLAFFSLLLIGTIFIMNKKLKENDESSILTEELYQLERENDDGNNFSIKIYYPQIQSLYAASFDKHINLILRDTAFSFFDDLEETTYDEVIDLLDEEREDTDIISHVLIEYEILQCTDTYISVIFTVASDDGVVPYSSQYIATINLKTGQYVHFSDLISMEEFALILMNDNFEIYEGTYAEFREEDAHERKWINRYIETFWELIEEPDINQFFGDVMEHSDNNPHYDRFSCQNIGLDKEYVYVYFTSRIAFEGYFIFRIPLKYFNSENIPFYKVVY